MRLEMYDLQSGYKDVLDAVLDHGQETAPRGRKTREIVGMELIVHKPWDVLPIGTGRGINTKIAALEALQLIGGVDKGELLVKAVVGKDGTEAVGGTPFADASGFSGAYGPRLRTQLAPVVQRLKDDPDTRGAVLQLWDSKHELGEDGCSYMCTIALQMLIRDGKLQMHALMRSNDAWLGLPYDAFMFTQLQITVANILGVPVGEYRHRATSMHLYEPHFEKAGKVTKPGQPIEGAPWGVFGETVREVQLNARAILDGKRNAGWYSRVLAPLFA